MPASGRHLARSPTPRKASRPAPPRERFAWPGPSPHRIAPTQVSAHLRQNASISPIAEPTELLVLPPCTPLLFPLVKGVASMNPTSRLPGLGKEKPPPIRRSPAAQFAVSLLEA